jgi:V8-like Glu-specific endopeptidase
MLGGSVMKRFAGAIALSATLLLSTASVSVAVTDGEPDGDNHPQVVLILMEVGGEPMYRCSGTLLSPTVVLTAGHCTNNYPDAPFTGMRVFTESDVQNGDNDYPYAGPNAVEAADWAAHPLYETAPFYLHDVGVVVLEQPIKLDSYGELPEANQLDVLKTKRGLKETGFTSVGYGLQKSFPTAAAWKNSKVKVRMVAYPRLIQINGGITGDYSLLLSNNANTGGTCFGDSGGPNFLGDSLTVAGITSFGMNSTCGGTGGVFRADRKDVLDFVSEYLNP